MGGSRSPALGQRSKWGSHGRSRSKAGFVLNPPPVVPGVVGRRRKVCQSESGRTEAQARTPARLLPAQTCGAGLAGKAEPQRRPQARARATPRCHRGAFPAPTSASGCRRSPPRHRPPAGEAARPAERCVGMISLVRSAPGGGGGAGTSPTSG